MQEHGYFHPSRGYWQTIGEPSAAVKATFPVGTVETPLKPSESYEWDGAEWVYSPPPVTKEQIHVERDRRIEGGLTVATSLGTVVAIQSDSVSRENLASLKDVAETMIAMGITDKITYRDLNNVEHELEPTEVRELWLLGVTYIQAIYKVSWALKALDPIPHDFADDSYWPSKEQA